MIYISNTTYKESLLIPPLYHREWMAMKNDAISIIFISQSYDSKEEDMRSRSYLYTEVVMLL